MMSINISAGRISVIQEGIVKLEFTPNVSINLEQAKEIYKARLTLKTDETRQLALMDIRTGPNPNMAARNFTKSAEVCAITHAMAILIGSPMSRILGNFFIGLNAPKFPTKLFTDEEAAVEWLKTMKCSIYDHVDGDCEEED